MYHGVNVVWISGGEQKWYISMGNNIWETKRAHHGYTKCAQQNINEEFGKNSYIFILTKFSSPNFDIQTSDTDKPSDSKTNAQ